MALSQKHAGKMLVPWFNSNEWKHVKNLIFSTNSTDVEMLQALDILQMWKIRTPKLPSGVEGTLIVLDVLLQKKDTVSDEKTRILYGASIMRFLNLCGAISDKQGTFYRTAKQNDLPDWLVDLRHDIAHDQIIPSMSMLKMGLEFCLDWLKREYWEKQNATIKDFIIDVGDKNKIKTMVELYCQLNLAYYSGMVENIQDVAHQDPLLTEKLICFGFNADTNADIKYVLEFILEEMHNEDHQHLDDTITEIIVTDGSIFATKTQQCENGKDELPRDFIMIWQDLINLLYLKNILFPLLKKLLNVGNNVEATEQTRKIASLWFAELCKSLLLAKNVYDQYNSLSNNEKLNKETATTVLKQLIQKANPDLKECLELDFQYCKEIVDDVCRYRLSALHNPHTYTSIFLKYFLQVCGCTEEYIKEMELLVNAYVFPQINSLYTYDLHTFEEFHRTTNSTDRAMDIVIPEEDSVTEGIISNNNVVQIETTPNSVPQKRWRIVEDTSIFKGCPLGVVAYQDRDRNPLLPQLPL